MKKMSVILLFSGFLLFAGQAMAQRDPAARMAEMKSKLMTDLKFTDVQADSVIAINQSTMPARRALFQDQNLSRDDKKAKMTAMTDSSDLRIKAVLGDSLFTKYKDWRKSNRPAGGMRGGPGTGGKPEGQ